MIASVEQIQNAIVKFIDFEIGAKATGFTKFSVYFMLPKISNTIKDMVIQYKDNPLFKDYVDSNGNIKVNELYNSAKTAISKSGQFTMYGLIFNENDIDKLYEYIKLEK
jgi:hypothetical protein